MTTAQLIHYLLTLFYGNHVDRHLLLAYYQWDTHYLLSNWLVANFVRMLIFHHPHHMLACLHALQHHVAYVKLGNVCPQF